MKRRSGVLMMVCLFISLKILSQTSLTDLNVIFKHNFENNTLGGYSVDEWKRDWLNPTWNNRLNTTKIVKSTDNSQNTSKCLQIFYPANSLGPREGGANWQAAIKTSNEIYISYDLMYMPGFEFQKGGKLPSAMSGSVNAGNVPNGYDGFTAGLSFNKDGQVRFYIYYPEQPGGYGLSAIWGHSYAPDFMEKANITLNYTTGKDIRCIPGTWHNITYRVVLNTIKSSGGGNHDGILEAYFDGKLVMQLSKILFRHTAKLNLDCMRMYSFFGGSTDDFRNPISQWLKVDNFLLYTFKDEIKVPRGNILSPTSRTINYWRKFNLPSSSTPVETVNNPPSLKNQEFTISEDIFENNNIGTVVATDSDPEQKLTYEITSGNESGIFTINSQSGLLSATHKNIFAPGIKSYSLGVKVSDNGSNPANCSAIVKVNLVGSSKIVYIDPKNLNDTGENGSIDHPFDSWKDITWIEGFTYLQKRGTVTEVEKLVIGSNNVVISAYGEGALPVIKSNVTTYLISAFEKSKITIENLNLQAPDAVSCIYMLGSSNDLIAIKNNIITASQTAIKIVDGNSLIIKYNLISSENEAVFSTAKNNEIYYNLFKKCHTAVNIMSSEATARIFNNVFYDNNESLSSTYADLTLFNNIFYMTTSTQKALSQGQGTLISNNNIFYPEHPNFVSIGSNSYDNLEDLQNTMKVDMNSFTKDPLFMDILSENFNLAAGSPAINKGMTNGVEADFLGTQVPFAGNTDIGMYEYKGSIPNGTDDLIMSSPVIQLYPNPAQSSVNILAEMTYNDDLQTENHMPELNIVDATGRIIFKKQIINSSPTTIQDYLDLSEFRNGVYIVILKWADKLIKEKLIVSR